MNNPRIAIAGGGPAGATLGAILAKEGMNVVLYEKARFPRHHVGEALQPAAFELLDFHLGMGKVFTEQGFAKKFGALYLWGDSRDCWSVLFDDRLEEELEDLTNETLMAGSFDHSWQVDRATFDKILLDEAERRGVEVHQDMEVVSPVLEGERVVGLEVRDKEGNLSTVNADLVVDATGQRCLLGRYFKTTEDLPDLQATATYAYMDGLGGVDSALSRNVQLVVTIPDGWVWWIPISDERTSVGVVTHRKRKLSEEEFLQMISDIGMPVEGGSLVADASGATLKHAKDWSYTHKSFYGPGWMMVGDAACFTDPILSGGVDFAIRGACNASVAILRVLQGDGPVPEEHYRAYQAQLQKEFDAYLRLARYWYNNNRSIKGAFWEANEMIQEESLSTPLRAFKYLTSGRYDADNHFRIFTEAQEFRMFKALGVNKKQLKKALERAKSRLEKRKTMLMDDSSM